MHRMKQMYIQYISPNTIKLFAVIVVLLVGIQFILSSWIVISGDVFYNEDIARDLLLMEHIVTAQPLTLIGPRISVAGGLYHGPFWLYFNIPVYLLGQGNPVVMGIFWQLLYLGLLGITFYVARKMFNTTVGLCSVLLLSAAGYLSVLNNTYGAVLLFPLYFYSFAQYFKTTNVKYLFIAFFVGGFLIQSEVAFGGPVLLLSVLYLLVYLLNKHKLHHFLSLGIVLIPLSTYVLFDVRHGFLQTHAIVSYITSHKSIHPVVPFGSFVVQHFSLITQSSLGMIAYGSQVLTFLLIIVFVYAFLASRKKGVLQFHLYLFFNTLYLGFWILSLMYKDGMWVWYYNEFTPIIIILFCSSYRFFNKYVFFILFFLLYAIGMQHKVIQFESDKNSFIGRSAYSWQMYDLIAREVYNTAPDKFGYFINEHDSLGYRIRYAMHYVSRVYHVQGNENVKMPTTYLIIDRNLDNEWWKKERVHLTKSPVDQITIGNMYDIEQYHLDRSEIAVPSDPNLIDSLFFR